MNTKATKININILTFYNLQGKEHADLGWHRLGTEETRYSQVRST